MNKTDFQNKIINLLWKEFDLNNLKKTNFEKVNNTTYDCTHHFIDNGSIYVCDKCGLIENENKMISSNFNTLPSVNKKGFNKTDKIYKMQEWYMWSNEEKTSYKLKIYVTELCKRLNISENLLENINETVNMVMEIIKKNDGTKRARVKDGIIVFCIEYVSKNSITPYSSVSLAKMLNLDIKYVSKAEKLILELIQFKKLNLDKTKVLQPLKPYDYVFNTVRKNNIKINEDVLKRVKKLIDFCEYNDILLDHTPLSVGVCCFYYILLLENIEVDIKLFSELYNLSVVTVIKTYNKLCVYKDIIEKNI